MSVKYNCYEFAVNSKLLKKDVQHFIEHCLHSYNITWDDTVQLEGFSIFIEDFLHEKKLKNIITQYKAVCKYHSITKHSVDYTIEISYKQYNCINMTKLVWIISPYEKNDEEDFLR
jgi:hypothetical protein